MKRGDNIIHRLDGRRGIALDEKLVQWVDGKGEPEAFDFNVMEVSLPDSVWMEEKKASSILGCSKCTAMKKETGGSYVCPECSGPTLLEDSPSVKNADLVKMFVDAPSVDYLRKQAQEERSFVVWGLYPAIVVGAPRADTVRIEYWADLGNGRKHEIVYACPSDLKDVDREEWMGLANKNGYNGATHHPRARRCLNRPSVAKPPEPVPFKFHFAGVDKLAEDFKIYGSSSVIKTASGFSVTAYDLKGRLIDSVEVNTTAIFKAADIKPTDESLFDLEARLRFNVGLDEVRATKSSEWNEILISGDSYSQKIERLKVLTQDYARDRLTDLTVEISREKGITIDATVDAGNFDAVDWYAIIEEGED